METPKQISEQAWIEQSTKRWHELESEPTKFDDPFIQGISDYKEALREALENERTLMQDNCRRYHLENFMHHTDKHYTKILELIETVTPKE